MQIPPNVYWYDAVQVILLVLCMGGIGTLLKLAFGHEKRLVKLETLVGNHHTSRLERVRKELGIEWEGREKDDE